MRGSFEPAGFCWAGFVCLVLAVLKLTGEAHWSWWLVLLPFEVAWATTSCMSPSDLSGFLSLMGPQQQAVTIRQGHGGYDYQVAALVCLVVFDVLRRIEGQQETIFLWVSSGRWETIVVFGMLSVIMQLLFCSEIVDPGNRRTRGG